MTSLSSSPISICRQDARRSHHPQVSKQHRDAASATWAILPAKCQKGPNAEAPCHYQTLAASGPRIPSTQPQSIQDRSEGITESPSEVVPFGLDPASFLSLSVRSRGTHSKRSRPSKTGSFESASSCGYASNTQIALGRRIRGTRVSVIVNAIRSPSGPMNPIVMSWPTTIDAY